MSVKDYSYLIIGGAPKSGTTSLYKWLSEHPEVCASSLKETRFFLDGTYPLPSASRFNGDNLEEYDTFFTQCDGRKVSLRLDATPDYLYSVGALRIAEHLPNAKIVFVLRDPVDRMVSWYKYARQRGLIDVKITFGEYVRAQIDQEITPDTPVHMQALEQGRYEKYLSRFKSAFESRMLIVNFDDLKEKPLTMMNQVCSFSGLDSQFYENYTFGAENVSKLSRLPWINVAHNNIRKALVYTFRKYPLIMNFLKIPNMVIKKALTYLHAEADKVVVDPELYEIIRKESGVIDTEQYGKVGRS